MLALLRSIKLLALVMWVGGLLFFVSGVAPVVFSQQVLDATGSTRISGMIVGASLARLHWMGLGCGLVMLATWVALYLYTNRAQGLMIVHTLVTLGMMFGTAYSLIHLVPLMEHDRQLVGGDISAARGDSAERMDFDRLHKRSTVVEGGVLLLGFALVVLTAAEPQASADRNSFA